MSLRSEKTLTDKIETLPSSGNDTYELSGVYVLPKNEMNDERSVAIPLNMAIAMMTKKEIIF